MTQARHTPTVDPRSTLNGRERLRDCAHLLYVALRDLVADIEDYERVNNLAPNPGKRDCWQSVTRARAAIAKAKGE